MYPFLRSGYTAERLNTQIGWIFKCPRRFEKWHIRVDRWCRIFAICTSAMARNFVLRQIAELIKTQSRQELLDLSQRERNMKEDMKAAFYENECDTNFEYPYVIWTKRTESSIHIRRIIQSGLRDELFVKTVPGSAYCEIRFKSLLTADTFSAAAVDYCWDAECDEPPQDTSTRCQCGRIYCRTHHPDPKTPCPFCQNQGGVEGIKKRRFEQVLSGKYPILRESIYEGIIDGEVIQQNEEAGDE